MILGLLIEIIQETVVPGRYFDTKDLIANTIGIIFGVLISDRMCIKLVKNP